MFDQCQLPTPYRLILQVVQCAFLPVASFQSHFLIFLISQPVVIKMKAWHVAKAKTKSTFTLVADEQIQQCNMNGMANYCLLSLRHFVFNACNQTTFVSEISPAAHSYHNSQLATSNSMDMQACCPSQHAHRSRMEKHPLFILASTSLNIISARSGLCLVICQQTKDKYVDRIVSF